MSRRKPVILCVEDHWNGLIGRKIVLENNGYEVLEAAGGNEGLKLFKANSVDAVILDHMPGMNGDVATRMKSVNSDVPIMPLSAYGPLPKKKLKAVDNFLSKSQPPRFSYPRFKIYSTTSPSHSSASGSMPGGTGMKERSNELS
jgi:CheY-like chemotaxis protein